MGFWPVDAGAIAALTGGRLRGDAGAVAVRLSTDTRAGTRAGDLFVALVGPHFDGARFATAALDDGAAVAVVARGSEVAVRPGAAVVEVDDPLAALQALAAEARRRFAGTVVAITGSNGKTIVKDMLAAALGGWRRVAVSPMSYNSQVGVALSLLQLDPDAELALIECGISRPGEMARLRAMVRPDVGALTNIGDAHLATLGDRRVTAREKAALFASLPMSGVVVVHADQALARAALTAVSAPVLALGREPARGAVWWSGREVHLDAATVALPADVEAEVLREDAALAAAVALHLGAPPDVVTRGLARWAPAPMRLELTSTPRGVLVLNDAYTADPESVDGALRALAAERGAGASIAVLGGMAQLGLARAAAHKRVGERVVELGVDRLIGVGPGGAEIADAARAAGMDPSRVHTVAETSAAAALLDEHAHAGDRVLLKASRPDRLERLSAVLFDAVAPARLLVDLDAIVANFRRIQRFVGRDVAVMGVVKAFGYGLDASRVARALQTAGVDHLGVAYPDEGIALRDVGITVPILVQNVLPHEVDKVVANGLTAQVASLAQLDLVAAEAARQGRPVRVHVKVDTGMGRAGAFPPEAVALLRAAADRDVVVVDGLMTHFAAADEPAQDAYTRAQIAAFAGVVAAAEADGVRPRWVHACNSAGLARFPEAHFTMVRAGLGMLGYAEVDGAPLLGQEPVLRLVTRVVSVKDVPAHHAVGYGMTWHTGDTPRRIAVVALGYGDGYPRALSNRGEMAVRGARCPVVGRVCMDVSMLDVTGVDGVVPGDEVVVYGGAGEPSLVDAARRADTIPYELLTRISHRVRRIYGTSR